MCVYVSIWSDVKRVCFVFLLQTRQRFVLFTDIQVSWSTLTMNPNTRKMVLFPNIQILSKINCTTIKLKYLIGTLVLGRTGFL